MHLVRDVLDNQLEDPRGNHIGRIDGLTFEVREGQPPRVVAIESGIAVLGRRIGRRTERLVLAIARFLHLPAQPRTRIEWQKVRYVGLDVEVAENKELVGTQTLERWLRDHVVLHIPGSRK